MISHETFSGSRHTVLKNLSVVVDVALSPVTKIQSLHARSRVFEELEKESATQPDNSWTKDHHKAPPSEHEHSGGPKDVINQAALSPDYGIHDLAAAVIKSPTGQVSFTDAARETGATPVEVAEEIAPLKNVFEVSSKGDIFVPGLEK